MTPFYAMFGREALNPTLFVAQDVLGNTRIPALDEYVQKQKDILESIRHAQLETQRTMEIFDNRTTKDVRFEVGDKVYLSTNNISTSHFKQKAHKLKPTFIGPFDVIEQMTKNTYKLKLPKEYRRLHPVFHAALLLRYVERPADMTGGNNTQETPTTHTEETLESEQGYSFEKVISRKLIGGKYHYLVKWKDFDHTSNYYITEDDKLSPEAHACLREFVNKREQKKLAKEIMIIGTKDEIEAWMWSTSKMPAWTI